MPTPSRQRARTPHAGRPERARGERPRALSGFPLGRRLAVADPVDSTDPADLVDHSPAGPKSSGAAPRGASADPVAVDATTAATATPKTSAAAQAGEGSAATLVARGFAEQYRDNVARLSGAQKSGHGVPPYTRYINRPIGRRLAAMAAILRLTPNAVTGISMLASYLGMALLCLVAPSQPVAIAVALLLLLGYALDSADGQLARLTGRGGPAGEWLDHVSDQARTVSLHMAVLIWLYRFVEPAPAVYLLPMAWAVVVSTRFLSQILGEQFRRAGAARTTDEATDRYAGVRALLQLPSDAGVVCLMFVLVGTPETFLLAYGALLVLNALLALVSMRRRYVELRPRARRTA